MTDLYDVRCVCETCGHVHYEVVAVEAANVASVMDEMRVRRETWRNSGKSVHVIDVGCAELKPMLQKLGHRRRA